MPTTHGPMKIFVDTLEGTTIAVDVETLDAIGNGKGHVQGKDGVSHHASNVLPLLA